MMTGIDLVHIPYRDSYWPDLLAGQTQILFAPVISATGYVQSGQLRALAVTTRTRLEAMPAIPALDEFVPGYERSEEHTSELQSLRHLVCRLLLEKKKKTKKGYSHYVK